MNIKKSNDTNTDKQTAKIALASAGMSGILGIVTFCFWPNPSQILVWAILAAALLGIFLGILTRQTGLGKRAIIGGGINATIWLVIAVAVQLAKS